MASQRTRHLRIRLTEPEASAIKAAAQAAGRRLSDQVRATLFEDAPPIPAPAPAPQHAEDLAELDRLRELRRIGANLNQIAFRLNARGDQAGDVGRALEELRTSIEEQAATAASRRRRR